MFFGYLEVSNFKEKLETKRVSSTSISQISRPEAIFKKLFLKISQNSQVNICAGVSFLKKLQTFSPHFYLK